MSNVMGYAQNTEAVRKRVHFYNKESSAATIYEGMPVCYLFDTTTNESGWSKSSDAAGSTTAEGSQNEGKYLRVECPEDDNLLWFAGVVASGDWCGKSVAATSTQYSDGKECYIDIYIPNGAIVPVRAGVACTVGRTVLAVISDVQYLGQPLSATQARAVGIAEETVDRSSPNGLVLARLNPAEFIYQELTGTALIVAASGTGSIVANRINITSAQTGGYPCALWLQTAITGAGVVATGYALTLYAEADISAAVAGQTPAAAVWTNLTGGTQTEPIFGFQVGIYEDGATLTSSNIISILTLTSQFAENPAANTHCWIHLENNGTYPPDCLIRAGAIADLGAVALSGDVTFTTAGIKIPIYISGSSTTYYIPAQPSI